MTIIEICVIIIAFFMVLSSLVFIILGILGVSLVKKLNKLLKKPAKVVAEVSDSVREISHNIKEEAGGIVENLRTIKNSIFNISENIKNEVKITKSGLIPLIKSAVTYLKKRQEKKQEKEE